MAMHIIIHVYELLCMDILGMYTCMYGDIIYYA